MKKYVLDQVVVRREPYFIPSTSNKKQDQGVTPMDVGNMMNNEMEDENKGDDHNHDEVYPISPELAALKGGGKGFSGN